MAKRRKTPPSTSKMTEYHRTVVAWLQAQGATDIACISRNRHVRLQFAWRDQSRFVTLASTPGDRAAARIARRDLRHMMGLVGGPPS
jgi:hypothetical protein